MSLTRLSHGTDSQALTPLGRPPAANPESAPVRTPPAALQAHDNLASGFIASGVPATNALASPSLTVPQQTQEGNACGTTSLSMVLNYFDAPATVRNVTTIDRAIRPHTRDLALDSFTAPVDLARYANRNGFRAVLHQNSQPEDLARLIDQGIPPIILYDSSSDHSGTGLHYVVVNGYQGQGEQREWHITDPGGYTWNMPNARLMSAWSHLSVNGVSIPYNRLMIAVAPSQGSVALPGGNRTPAAAVQLPSANSPRLVDWAGGVATGAIGVATRIYDTAQSVSGAVQQSGHWVQARLSAVGGAVRGVFSH